jgi:hypothetical protein
MQQSAAGVGFEPTGRGVTKAAPAPAVDTGKPFPFRDRDSAAVRAVGSSEKLVDCLPSRLRLARRCKAPTMGLCLREGNLRGDAGAASRLAIDVQVAVERLDAGCQPVEA